MQNVGSVLGTATRLEGTLFVDESIRIDGALDGNIEQTDGDSRWLILGSAAVIRGDIRAQNVSVAGKVLGNIVASGSVELRNGSEVRGNITHKSITVEPGASVHGQLIASEAMSAGPEAAASGPSSSG